MSLEQDSSISTTPHAERAQVPSRAVIALGTAAMCLIWGSTWIVIKAGLEHMPPFKGASIRFFVAYGVMVLVAPGLALREGGRRPSLRLSLQAGVCTFGVPYALVYWAETQLPSGLTSLLWATFPMMMAFAGHFYLRERLAARQWLGFVLGFAGVACLFLTDLRELGPGAVPAGAILLLSPAVSTVGTSYIKRHGAGTSSVLLNRDGMLIGALVLTGAALLTERGQPVQWTAGALLSIAYLSLVGTVMAFGLYFWVMRYASATRLGLVAYVVPAIALTLGVVLADEPFGPYTAAGMGLILVGVLLVRRRVASGH